MSVVRGSRTSRERPESLDARACHDHDALPPVQAASARRTTAWIQGLDRLARRRPDAVDVSPLAVLTLDSLRASA